MLQLLVRRGVGDEETVAVRGREAPDYATPRDRGVHHGDRVAEFGFEGARDL